MTWEMVRPWLAFLALIAALLVLDLGVIHRRNRVIGMKEALLWSIFWVVLSLAFNAFVYVWKGPGPAAEFLTGWTIERSLSIDNIFVFVLIFSYFRVPAEYQYRVLVWGIIGALFLRAIMIGGGAWLLHRFGWIEYVFGAVLLLTAFRMVREGTPEVHPEGNQVVRIFRRFIPVTADFVGSKFFIRQSGVLSATPLFIVLLLVETTDVVFAFDSIPAIFGVTRDPFIAFTSNIFAILGLRALYFLLANILGMFRFLNIGLALVLSFIGLKMVLSHWITVSIAVSLAVVIGILLLAIAASLLFRPRGLRN